MIPIPTFWLIGIAVAAFAAWTAAVSWHSYDWGYQKHASEVAAELQKKNEIIRKDNAEGDAAAAVEDTARAVALQDALRLQGVCPATPEQAAALNLLR